MEPYLMRKYFMATQKKTRSLKKIIKNKSKSTVPVFISKEKWLEHIIKATKDQITNKDVHLDELFNRQADRLTKELENLRKTK